MKISVGRVVKRGNRLTVERRRRDSSSKKVFVEEISAENKIDAASDLNLAQSKEKRPRRRSGSVDESLKSLKQKIFGNNPEPGRRSGRTSRSIVENDHIPIGRKLGRRAADDNFFRDDSDRNIVPSETLEHLPQEQPKPPAEKGAVQLEDISDEDLLAEFKRRKRLRPSFVAALNAVDAEAASGPPAPVAASEPMTDGAPRPRWKEQQSEYNGPWHFLEANYGKENLTWPDIYKDRDLYFALKNNIKRNKIIPEGFTILDRVAVTDRKIAEFSEEERKRARALSSALERREAKARKSASENNAGPR